ncbi:MAG: uncharacterized protein QOE70_2702 [Chthoniobacter sp.]|jgi:predicted RND superfamily exporter protein|nr:uncharacterized protein [Chthoniobacter sp.]
MQSNRLRWIALGAAALVFVVAGLSRISFNIDILKLLPTHLPQVEGLSLFLKHFAQPRELIITLEAEDSDTAEAAADDLAERLRQRPDLVQRAVSRAPWEKNPADLAELLAFMVLNQPPEAIRELTAHLTPERAPETLQATLEKLNESVSPQEVALRSYDPYDLAGPLASAGLMSGEQQSEFSSADGTFRVIYVESPKAFPNYKATIAWLKEIKREAGQWRGQRGIALGYTGEPAFVADISGSTEWDMMSSGFVTLIVIALIFWLCYRRARPLLDLQAMLVLIFSFSLAAAGLFLNQLTVIGVGCAAIMIGLSVDYGYFVYHRSQQHRGTVRELQSQCVQNIAWTAGTTAAAFFALNLSSLPGLSQLGSLVGIGVIVGAFVMLGIFAPLTMRFRRREGEREPSALERLFSSPRFLRGGAWVALAVIAVLLGALALKGLPSVDFSARTLRPRVSEAYSALDRLYSRLMDDRDMLSLVVTGGNEQEVLTRLRAAEAKLQEAKTRGEVRTFRSALAIWPDVAHQQANLATLAALAPEAPRLKQTLQAAGFNDEAFALTEAALRQWAAGSAKPLPIWPENESSRWIFRRAASRGEKQTLALGIVQPIAGREEALAAAVESPGVYLVSWNRLGSELKHIIPREFGHVILGLAGIVLLLLALAFRSARAVGLFVVTTGLVLVCLAGAMSLLGMRWNFFNLAALLLLLGTGTDYSILILLALKRNGGNAAAAQRELGLIICLCVSSASAGFGTISWANNLGLASLGQTCALGLLIDALISLFLLPRAWELLHPRKTDDRRGATRQDRANG